MSAQERLTAILWDAIQQLTQIQKAGVLFNTALALIDDGRYGEEVENYIDAYLQTPGLPKEDVARALLARSKARSLSGGQLLPKDLHALGSSNEQAQSQLTCKGTQSSIEPAAWQRVPSEIWEEIAAHTPRYHLRAWLFLSRFHWDIASRHIFHTVDIDFGGYEDDLHRGIDMLYQARSDPIFASRVKTLRVDWHGNHEEMLALLLYVFEKSLPAFTALREFECIKLPEEHAEMVQALLGTHKNLHGLGLISWSHRGLEIPFDNLRKFSLCTEDDEGSADRKMIRKVLKQNKRTLKHLILGGGHSDNGYWNLTFKFVIVHNLTHLDLVDSLTLGWSFDDPHSAAVLFASDRIVNGSHTLLPHLETFRLALDPEEQDDDLYPDLYPSVVYFLQKREKLRRLDLGNCPCHMVRDILPDLGKLKVLGIHVDRLSQGLIKTLVESIPTRIAALDLSVSVSEIPLNEYPQYFICFNTLSFLSLSPSRQPTSDLELKNKTLDAIAATVPSLDFLACYGDVYVVTRSRSLQSVRGVDDVGDDAAWLLKKSEYR